MLTVCMMPSVEHAADASSGKAVVAMVGARRGKQAVQRMFTAIATRYDLNNSLLSFGLHHRWKALAAGYIPALTHGRALDLGAGTGDLALLLDRRMGEYGRVAAMDLNFGHAARGRGEDRPTRLEFPHRLFSRERGADRVSGRDVRRGDHGVLHSQRGRPATGLL